MTVSTNIQFLQPACVYYTGLYTQSTRSGSRWWRRYKSHGSFPVYLASRVKKWSNDLILGQKLAPKVSKSCAIPPYVPGVNPPGEGADKCIRCRFLQTLHFQLKLFCFHANHIWHCTHSILKSVD